MRWRYGLNTTKGWNKGQIGKPFDIFRCLASLELFWKHNCQELFRYIYFYILFSLVVLVNIIRKHIKCIKYFFLLSASANMAFRNLLSSVDLSNICRFNLISCFSGWAADVMNWGSGWKSGESCSLHSLRRNYLWLSDISISFPQLWIKYLNLYIHKL